MTAGGGESWRQVGVVGKEKEKGKHGIRGTVNSKILFY